jgi:hypothetical protein
MRSFVMSVAALALIAGTAHAQGQGQGKGRGNDRGGGNPAAATMQAAGGQGQGQGQGRGQEKQASSGRGADSPSMAESRGAANRAEAGQRGKSAERGNGNENRAARAVERAVERPAENRGRGNNVIRNGGIDGAAGVRREAGRDPVRVRDLRDIASVAPRGAIDGCPPGLAKKNPPCVPPGLARNSRAWRSQFDRPDWWGLSRLTPGRYAYEDGYLLRLGSDGRIGGYVPLLGGALSAGNLWPSFYEPVRLPDYYANYYGLGPVDNYRFADNVIYRVDPETTAITAITALLTGDNFSVGQPMPLGYDVYNVPWNYRDQYFDRPDALYRYADGQIYQVDPQTRLIAAAIELIAS